MAISSRQATALWIQGCSMAEGDRAQAVGALLGCSMDEYRALLDTAIDDPEATVVAGDVVASLLQERQQAAGAGTSYPLVAVDP